jgi:hypothetical protein
LGRSDVSEEIDALDAQLGGGGAAEAVQISFFCSDSSPEDIMQVEPSSLLAHVIVINYRPPGEASFKKSYIYEAILPPPHKGDPKPLPLLNNFVTTSSTFTVTVKDREFQLCGVYYCQQNGSTNVCAHACLRMALNSSGLAGATPITNKAINDELTIVTPANGLTLGQIAGFLSTRQIETLIVDCTNLSSGDYAASLAAIVESGHAALLVFTTGNNCEHVVTVFGHTRNSDEWHPQAIPAYSGPRSSQFFPSALWSDHFIIHDDNFGPYFALSNHALEIQKDVKPHWIVGLLPLSVNCTPVSAQAIASVILSNSLPQLATLGSGRWFEYITRQQWEYVLRTLLVGKNEYIDHIEQSIGHDKSRVAAGEATALSILPDRFWLVEFSLPSLFLGNRTKLGEVLISCDVQPDPTDLAKSVLSMRVPGLIITKDGSGGFESKPSSLTSHSPGFGFGRELNTW